MFKLLDRPLLGSVREDAVAPLPVLRSLVTIQALPVNRYESAMHAVLLQVSTTLIAAQFTPSSRSCPDTVVGRTGWRHGCGRPSPAAATGPVEARHRGGGAVPAGSRIPYQQSPNLITGHCK
ncbi:hypothetical protein [Streptomyces flavidovirens]|uniref:hypothetical protein n=1 Tax=Streptomyces flavidovirens TaxID=67298 RepID=UPI003683F732